ncbi:hypothetical protein [Actinocatenispora sera]|uniref:Uncharacterized protein n=1 Tax=Actinocatenispora sera TaxID=390989 RepID=A0A810KT94_9ACTN|nr:hypothetical protein [Actinocatenispora sera]BCJ26174.1 hypothetical protein Asera_02820 [Actinocatenispora sera]
MGGTEMDRRWVAAWGTAQQLAPALDVGSGPQMPDEPAAEPTAPAELGAQTVRMVARPTVGGTAVRVALANSFGHPPVRIGAAYLAGPGGTVPLAFGGRSAVILPTGAQLHSDPVEYEVSAQTDLVVSRTWRTRRCRRRPTRPACVPPGSHRATRRPNRR